MKPINNIILKKENGVYKAYELDSSSITYNLIKNQSLDVIFVMFNNVLDLTVNVLNEGINVDVKCLYLASLSHQIQINMRVCHQQGGNTSNQVIKGIALDDSSVHFNGLIQIDENAQKVNSNQNHRGVVLSDNATIKAVPELQIYADDVLCAHGSAVGPLSDDVLFYLQTRGIDKNQAQKMLLHAFLVDFLPDEYTYIIEDWINEHV